MYSRESVIAEKKSFVENELSTCLKASGVGVEYLIYQCIGYRELVTIHFVGGGQRIVNVEGDSKAAIIEDVMKHVY